jgi:hypothetical protein
MAVSDAAYSAKSLRDWLIAMVIDGWKPISSGNGKFLYLEKDGQYYVGPVFTGESAVMWIKTAAFWEDVEKQKGGQSKSCQKS